MGHRFLGSLLRTLCVATIVALVGCEDDDRPLSPSDETPDLEGPWKVTNHRYDSTGTMTLSQNRNTLTGEFKDDATGAVYDCSGYIGGSSITLTIIRTSGEGTLYLSGSAGRNSMSGTWSDNHRDGKWSAVRL